MSYPTGIIFINSNISEQVLDVVKRQLRIDYIYNFDYFNESITNDGYFGLNQRLLVLVSDFENVENREKADVVLYIKMGLAYILKNNFGPTGLTVQVDRMYIHKLFLENGKDLI